MGDCEIRDYYRGEAYSEGEDTENNDYLKMHLTVFFTKSKKVLKKAFFLLQRYSEATRTLFSWGGARNGAAHKKKF